MPLQTHAITPITQTHNSHTHTGPGSPLRVGGSCKHFGETKPPACGATASPSPAGHAKESRGERSVGAQRRGLPAAPAPRRGAPGPVALTPRTPGRPRSRSRRSGAAARAPLAPACSALSPRSRGCRPSRPGLAPVRPPRSDVRRLGAGYLWQGYSEISLGRVLIAVSWDL